MDRRQKQTLIAAVAALLGLVLILGVVLIASKEHRFKTYRNKAGGFSIRYPAAWEMRENTGGAAVIFFSPKENDLDVFKENVNVVVQDISGNPMDLNAYTKLAIDQMRLVFEDNFIIVETVPVFVAGQRAHRLVFIGKGPDNDLKYMSIWLIRDLTAYQITYTALATKYDRYIAKVKKMIGSFRID